MVDRSRVFALVFTLAGVGACTGLGQSRDAKLALDPGAVAAIDRMAAARCERVRTCGGAAGDQEACFEHLRVQTATELRLSRCGGDVQPAVLDQCVDAIRRRACDDPRDDVSAIWACRVGALCVSGPEEGSV